MTRLALLTIALTTVLALGACGNRFADEETDVAMTGATGAGGLAPSSPAYFQQSVGDRVFFPVDQSTLTDAARATLDAQANWLNSNPSYQVVIEGHADEQGTREYNLALGARRAASAEEYLVSRGVAGNRIDTVSYGKERPVEVCSTEQCYSRNRRSVTVLQGAGT